MSGESKFCARRCLTCHVILSACLDLEVTVPQKGEIPNSFAPSSHRSCPPAFGKFGESLPGTVCPQCNPRIASFNPSLITLVCAWSLFTHVSRETKQGFFAFSASLQLSPRIEPFEFRTLFEHYVIMLVTSYKKPGGAHSIVDNSQREDITYMICSKLKVCKSDLAIVSTQAQSR